MEGPPNEAKRSGGFHLTFHFNAATGVYFAPRAHTGRERGLWGNPAPATEHFAGRCVWGKTPLCCHGCLSPSTAFWGVCHVTQQWCILQRGEATGTRGARQRPLRRSKAASEHFLRTAGTGKPRQVLLEAAGDHAAGHPRRFCCWKEEENLKTQEMYCYLHVWSSWSLRGDAGRDVSQCIASLGAQFWSTIVLDT